MIALVPLLLAVAHVTVAPTALPAAGPSTVTVSGTGFVAPRGGFGGIYVLFGTVDGRWQPSAGGVSGTDYRYQVDAQTKDNHGYSLFLSDPAGSTLSAANGVMTEAGSWTATLAVPGPVLTVTGPDGRPQQVDCRTVTCGVITIGAHGVAEPTNETFTPVSFAAETPAGQAIPTSSAPAPAPAPAPVRTTASVVPAHDHDAVPTWLAALAAALVAGTAAGLLRTLRRHRRETPRPARSASSSPLSSRRPRSSRWPRPLARRAPPSSASR